MKPFRRRYSFLISHLLAALIGCADDGKSSVTEHEAPSPSPLPAQVVNVSPEFIRPVRAEVVRRLWASRFGRQVEQFLFSDASPVEVTERAQNLSNYIFQQGGRAITILSGFQLLKDDVYERGLLVDEVYRRISVLETAIWQRQIDAQSYPGEGIAYQAVVAFVAFLPLGSPVIRNGLKSAVRAVTVKFAPRLFEGAPRVSARQFFSRAAFKDYQLSEALKRYFNYFGPYSMAWFFWYDWTSSASGHSIPVHIESLEGSREVEEYISELEKL